MSKKSVIYHNVRATLSRYVTTENVEFFKKCESSQCVRRGGGGAIRSQSDIYYLLMPQYHICFSGAHVSSINELFRKCLCHSETFSQGISNGAEW